MSLVLLLVGCGAGYRTVVNNGSKKVYRVDDEGKKTLVYEVSKDGVTTIHDESDPMAQQQVAAQERAAQAQQAEEERLESIRQAPKRRIGDPIYVALYDIQLGEKLQQAQKSDGAVDAQYRKEFESDGVITLVSNEDLKKGEYTQIANAMAGMSPNRAPAADVDVVSKAYVKEVVGINKQTGKPGSMMAVVFEATISSNYLPAEYTVTEQGNIFQNVQVTKRFADEIKSIIKETIGPTLPANRNI
jgi:hypothetical protein